MSRTTAAVRHAGLAQRILAADGRRELYEAVAGRHPAWFRGLVARLDVVLGELDDDAYLTAGLDGAAGEVTVLTRSLVVAATITDFQAADEGVSAAKVTVRAVPVRLVRSMSVEGVSEVTDRHDWPHSVSVTLVFDGSPDVHLPAPGLWANDGVELVAAVRALLAGGATVTA